MLAANRAISTIFQEVQEFSLQSQWKFADLVEKQAATICELYQTGLIDRSWGTNSRSPHPLLWLMRPAQNVRLVRYWRQAL